MIMSQTKIFNFFLGSVHANSIVRILSSFTSRYKNASIPNRNIWINRLYFNVSNSKLKQCLTIDTGDANDLVPGKFRMQADSGTEQIRYYNRNKKDTSFNSFSATRKESSPSEINFSSVKVIDNVNKHDSTNFDTSDELSDFKNDIVQRTIQRVSESDTVGKTTTKNSIYDDENIEVMVEAGKSQDFFQDKSRNFLTNIAYASINKEDYYNDNFAFDVHLLLTKNLSPFLLNRKLADKTNMK